MGLYLEINMLNGLVAMIESSTQCPRGLEMWLFCKSARDVLRLKPARRHAENNEKGENAFVVCVCVLCCVM